MFKKINSSKTIKNNFQKIRRKITKHNKVNKLMPTKKNKTNKKIEEVQTISRMLNKIRTKIIIAMTIIEINRISHPALIKLQKIFNINNLLINILPKQLQQAINNNNKMLKLYHVILRSQTHNLEQKQLSLV